jgi:hypothetical protein
LVAVQFLPFVIFISGNHAATFGRNWQLISPHYVFQVKKRGATVPVPFSFLLREEEKAKERKAQEEAAKKRRPRK